MQLISEEDTWHQRNTDVIDDFETDIAFLLIFSYLSQ